MPMEVLTMDGAAVVVWSAGVKTLPLVRLVLELKLRWHAVQMHWPTFSLSDFRLSLLPDPYHLYSAAVLCLPWPNS